MKKFKVAIAGCGARGLHCYAQYQHYCPEQMEIVALADTNQEQLRMAKEEFNVPENNCFHSAEEMFSKGKLADVVFIATQDQDHRRHAIMAIEAGYDILLEKPVSNTLEDCLAIRDEAIAHHANITVCHVLRYTKFYHTIKELIQNGSIGDVVSVAAFENVGYWHQAHSFVRGNWRDSQTTSPMILAKCCHDFDIINWLLEKKCLSLNSYGSLKYFNAAHKPLNSSDRCLSCRCKDQCAFDAERFYITGPRGVANGYKGWPINVVMENPTVEGVREALATGPYGRCVFNCDNNVVDHQIVSMQYEDEITVSLSMTAFSSQMSRQIKIYGTKGEIVADQEPNTVVLRVFGKEDAVYDINKLATDLSGHGGGDRAMLCEMFESLEENKPTKSSIIVSIASHVQALASEYSRLHQGENILLEEFEKKFSR